MSFWANPIISVAVPGGSALIGAAEITGLLDSAIEQSKKYLALSKLFDDPKKGIETLRQLAKSLKRIRVFKESRRGKPRRPPCGTGAAITRSGSSSGFSRA